jgi:hypothetical protein
LSYTDPSGFFFSGLLKKIASIPILNMAVQAVLAFYCQVCLVAYNAASTYAVTGSLSAAFTSAVVSIISPGGASPGAILGTAVIGGLASKVQGGNFGHGFWTAGLGAAIGGRIKTGNAFANVLVSAVVGGTISKLTGGKFANGAQTGAFSAAMVQDWSSSEPLVEGSPEWEAREEEYFQKEHQEMMDSLDTGEGLMANQMHRRIPSRKGGFGSKLSDLSTLLEGTGIVACVVASGGLCAGLIGSSAVVNMVDFSISPNNANTAGIIMDATLPFYQQQVLNGGEVIFKSIPIMRTTIFLMDVTSFGIKQTFDSSQCTVPLSC